MAVAGMRMVLGEKFGPLHVTVDDHAVKCYAFAQDDYSPRYFAGGPGATRIVHPLLLGNHLLRVYEERYERHVNSGALHTQEEVWYSSPVRVGECVAVTGQYVDVYERRGRAHLVLEASAHGEDGRLLLRQRATEALGAGRRLDVRRADGSVVTVRDTGADGAPERVTGEFDPETPPVVRAHAGLAQGTPLVALRKRLTQEQMSVFSGAGQYERNLHTDLEKARQAGLERPIAQAMQVAGYFSELLVTFFGDAWFTGGWQRSKFLKPVFAGETLTIHGVVRSSRPMVGGTCVELEVWTLNAAGQRTAIGWATGVVGSGG